MRLSNLTKTILLSACLSASAAAQATDLFQDNFEADNIGYSLTSLSQWTMTDGSVDVIGAGSGYDFFPGNGKYIDLDGSTYNAAVMQTLASFNLLAGSTYTLSFDLGGSARPDGDNSVTVSLGDFSETFTLASDAPLTSYSRQISMASNMTSHLIFDHAGTDNMGLILDNVALSAPVPEPETWAMLVAGLALLGFNARRKSV